MLAFVLTKALIPFVLVTRHDINKIHRISYFDKTLLGCGKKKLPLPVTELALNFQELQSFHMKS